MASLNQIMGDFNPDQAIQGAEELKFTKPKDGKYYVKVTETKMKFPSDENMSWISPFDALLDFSFEIEADINGQECLAKSTDDSILLASDVSSMPDDKKRKQYHINAGRYGKYCKVLGQPPEDSDDFIGMQCVIELKTTISKGKEYQNVENVWPANAAAAAAPVQAVAAPVAATPPAAASKKPWEK